MTDIRVQQAREHDRAADAARALAARHLAQRDALVRMLYAEGTWSYSKLAKALGLTPELIAKIIKPQARPRRAESELVRSPEPNEGFLVRR